MEFIVFITGEVEHSLTIDPSVWIFDERKVNLDTFFNSSEPVEDELTTYKKAISAQWDREITEGSTPPSEQNNNKADTRFKKEELLSGSFGIPFDPFLKNATPKEDATSVVVETSTGESHVFNMKEAQQILLGFSKDGKPLRETGPVHVYMGDRSNKNKPITHVSRFVVK
ncbi:hypothetical protein [Bacillus sp. FJAT-45350]|uniref:hypothetical protein n=1 Tax=Bacillus sp. FJAT-45350 TaxID=2011014 RepID=UPI000BB9B431|nr:hypothetical protein [Bacillus sp. FJAT-45350]